MWVCQSVLSACLLLADLLRQKDLPWSVKVIWILVGFFMGMVGLLVYWLTFRRPFTRSDKNTIVIRALGSAALSATGCAFGIFLIFLSVSFVDQEANLGVFTLLIPYVLGLLLFRMPMMVFLYGLKYWKDVVRYILPELMSSIGAVVSIVFANQYLGNYFNDYSSHLSTPDNIVFCTQFSLYTFVGLITIYLVHFFLIHMKVNLWPEYIIVDSAQPVASRDQETGTLSHVPFEKG